MTSFVPNGGISIKIRTNWATLAISCLSCSLLCGTAKSNSSRDGDIIRTLGDLLTAFKVDSVKPILSLQCIKKGIPKF